MDPWGRGIFSLGDAENFPWSGAGISLGGVVFSLGMGVFTPPGNGCYKKEKTPRGGCLFRKVPYSPKNFYIFFLAIENQSYAI